MNKVFHFDAPREKYHCDAAIVWCFDNRFELGFRKFLKRIGVSQFRPHQSRRRRQVSGVSGPGKRTPIRPRADSQVHSACTAPGASS